MAQTSMERICVDNRIHLTIGLMILLIPMLGVLQSPFVAFFLTGFFAMAMIPFISYKRIEVDPISQTIRLRRLQIIENYDKTFPFGEVLKIRYDGITHWNHRGLRTWNREEYPIFRITVVTKNGEECEISNISTDDNTLARKIAGAIGVPFDDLGMLNWYRTWMGTMRDTDERFKYS